MVIFLVLKFTKIFQSFIPLGNFSEFSRTSNITLIPKSNPLPHFPLDYRPISVMPIISKVYKKLIFKRFYKYIDSIKFLLNTGNDSHWNGISFTKMFY